ncbi:cell division cycle-associated protein 2 isoform X4 [Phycodurus eques]|uniref:cell division cycle-associated protein 2 isoform X4 n=1 Tax=Phycodurus eques TaxID=693459 RepID=UPI002ACD89EC|nr:cell division cycle-associated protein 2 isoform X4 [Phycodurus eques]
MRLKMATEQDAVVDKETDQMEQPSPSKKDSATVLRNPLDFLKLTPSQFGITVQSFSPVPSGHKEKSRLAQLKARRRSSVGVRGSPETNSLIRFIAQQKMKNSSNCQTPELVRGSPFLPRVSSTLKQKMASFHNLMGVEEGEVSDVMPRKGDYTGGGIKTRDYLSDEYNQEEGKENHPPVLSPAPSKKRRVAPLEGCEGKIRETHTHTPDLRLNGSEEGDMEQVAECNDTVNKGLPRSSETEEETQPVLLSTPLRGCRKPPVSVKHVFSFTSNQQDNVFEPRSHSQVQPSELRSASPEKSLSAFQFSLRPSQLEIKPAEENSSSGASAAKKKMKRVHFGGALSPEFFDKHLPPSTPLQKGGTPARFPTPVGFLKLHSALKTPQKNETCAPQAQPVFSSVFCASPVLAVFHKHRMLPMAEDGVEEFEKIIFPSIEESDSTAMTDTELLNYAQLNLNNAFQDEPLSQVETTEVKSETSPAYQLNVLNELQSLSEEKQPESAVVKSESANGFPVVRSRKRKLPEERKPVRKSARSAAKPSETIKLTSTASNRWKKEVNYSLYGSRENASKNPTLSPITEFFTHHSAAAKHTPPTSRKDESSYLKSESARRGPRTAVSYGDSRSGAPVFTSKRATEKKRSSPRSRITRGLKKVNVSVDDLLCVEPQMQTAENTSENDEEEVTTITAVSMEAPSEHIVPEQVSAGAEEHCTQTDAVSPSTHTDANSECHLIVDGSTSACLLEETTTVTATTTATMTTTQQALNVSRSRRRSVNLADEKPKQEVETQQKKPSASKSESPEEEAQVNSGMASWQTYLNIEDVFKRVPSNGQRSVRRSLRNQSNTDNHTGLAWVLQLSPKTKQ